MIVTQMPFDLGSIVKVHSVFGGYPLPDGLDENERVMVISENEGGGYFKVWGERGEFKVFLANIDSGWYRRNSFSEKLPWD